MLRLGLVGWGQHGFTYPRYIAGNSRKPIGKIAALADINEQRLSAGQTALRLPDKACFTDDKEMLARRRLDGVIVVTPPDERDPVFNALEARKHIFCENPLTLRPIVASRICTIVEEHELQRSPKPKQLVVTVNEQWRFLPTVKKVKELVESGQLGELQQVVIRGKGRHAQKVEIPRIGSHLLSVASHCFAGELRHRFSLSPDKGASIYGMALTMRQGVTVSWEFTHDPSHEGDVGACSLELRCTRGRARLVGGLLERCYISSFPSDSVANAETEPDQTWLLDSKMSLPTVRTGAEDRAMNDPRRNRTFWLIRKWADAIERGKPNPSPPEHYLNTVSVMQSMLSPLSPP